MINYLGVIIIGVWVIAVWALIKISHWVLDEEDKKRKH